MTKGLTPTVIERAALPQEGPLFRLRSMMRRIRKAGVACLYTSLAFAGSSLPAMAENLPPLSLERIFDSPSLFGTPPSMPVWSADSKHLAFIWAEPGQPQPGLWVVREDGSKREQLGGKHSAASGAVREIAWLPDAKSLVSLRGDSLWLTSLSGDDRRLATSIAGASNLAVAPGGERVSWLKDGDLWVFDLATEKVSALTEVGIAPISALEAGRYRRPDREIGSGIWGGPTYQWSRDGKYVALHHVDRQAMRQVSFPDYLAPEDTSPNFVRRGYPGDPNESRSVGLLNVESGELVLLDMRDTDANQVVSFDWSPQGLLLLDVASDTAVDRWLYTVDPEQGSLNEVWHHRRDTRIYTRFGARWSPGGSEVLFLSDQDKYYGIYALDISDANAVPRRISDSGFDALAAPEVLAGAGAVLFPATGGRPSERHVYWTPATATKPSRVTKRPGHHDAYAAPNGRSVALVSSDDLTPPELYVGPLGGDGFRQVTHSPMPEFSQRQWAHARYVTFPSNIDGYTLHARILEPVNLKPGHRYPVVFGPMYSNTVRNRWAGVYTRVKQLLVQLGYIVVQVDVRGSTGYGRDFREEFLTDFAGEDVEDIVSAVDYIRTLPYVDEKRMGIWGSSYGGSLTVYTLLSKPGLFCAGVAGASAVDPYYFGTDDVAIVRTPASEPEIFAHRAEELAGRLEDHLMLMHGMQDQVVPFRTVASLAEALIREGRNFDTVFVPGATHAWRDEAPYAQFLFGKLIEYFDRHLKSEDCP